MKKIIYDTKNEIEVLEDAIKNIKTYGSHFVAYNTKFAGKFVDIDVPIEYKGDCIKETHEICFAYDDERMYLLSVHERPDGTKYAGTETSMCVYAYWDIIE